MKIDKKIIVIIVLVIVLLGIVLLYISSDSSTQNQISSQLDRTDTVETNETITISTTGEICSTLEENLELHATYYFEKVCVNENKYIEEGEKLVEYTNGTYLLAPYDCIITEINVPEAEKQCTNEHYIAVKAANTVSMSVSVDETQINHISIGEQATLYVQATGKTYEGYVTKISSTASNGKFMVVAEFQNDGDIKIGMTGKCTIIVV